MQFCIEPLRKLQLAMIIHLVFHFIRIIIVYYNNRDSYITFMLFSLLISILLELLCFQKKSLFQFPLQYIIILTNVILFQIESLYYSFSDVYENFLYLLILDNLQFEEKKKNIQVQKIVEIILTILIWLSFSSTQNYNSRQEKINVDYFRIFNQKINILLFIFLIPNKDFLGSRGKIKQISINESPTIQECTQKNQQELQILKSDTKRSNRSSIASEQSDAITERKLLFTKNLLSAQIDYNLLMDSIQEGIIIIKFEKDSLNISNPKVEYQNQMSKIMFSSSNNDLLSLFEQQQCEILIEESPITIRNSLLSLQSFSQKHFKQMKRSSKLNPASYFFQDSKQEVIPSPRLRSLTSQFNTVYKCIQYVYNTKKMRFEINGKIEATIIETCLEQNGSKKTIEIIVTIAGEDIVLLVARDVVHRKNIKELLDINQSKSKTLSFVSHEFRSPLNVMVNILGEIKEQKNLEKELYQNVSIVLENTHYMLNLSNDLLDLAQIKAEKFRLNIKITNIIDLGNECLQMFQLQAQQKQIQLQIKTNKKPLYIKTDRNRLKQILINLLANALKFTSKGSITIMFQQKDFLVDVGVIDTGIGINDENQKKLFKAFGKIMTSQHNQLNEQGVGLGLLISNKIAQQLSHDGAGLKIQSKEIQQSDHGSYFYLTLQIDDFHFKVESQKVTQIDLDSDSPNSIENIKDYSQFRITFNKDLMSFTDSVWIPDKKEIATCSHILIVDDNAFNLKILEMQIKLFTNAEIDRSNDGNEALQAVQQKKCGQQCQGYSAIFMDMEMPGLNGIETSKQILKLNEKQKIFIVSGYEDKQLQNDALKTGIKEFIVKPINKEKLQKIILENQL